MYGAIIGDIVGSVYERRADRIKTKEFPLFKEGSRFTDDSVLTVAVGNALVRGYLGQGSYRVALVEEMQRLGRTYIDAGFSDKTRSWILSDHPQPYGSFGNGAAMRVSPCGLMGVTLGEALWLATVSARVSHDHPEGIKGAQAVAAAVFMAKNRRSKEEIRDYIRENFYPLDKTLDEIRPEYRFDFTCQGSVPEAIQCFLESESYEDAVRNAVSLGGDSDTLAAIAGSIAWTYYMDFAHMYMDKEDWNEPFASLSAEADRRLPEEMIRDIEQFHKVWSYRCNTFKRVGSVRPVIRD